MSTVAAPAPSTVDHRVAAALEAEHLYRFYRADDEEVLALRGVSLTVAAGEVVVVCGPSGSGKSTLLNCLAGLDEPDGGTVRLGGRRLSHRPEAERAALRAEHIGVLFQYGNLLDHLTVEANVAFVRGLLHPRRGQSRRGPAPRDTLASVGLEGRGSAYPAELSGGEMARASLAVALANDPAILVADEPTGELDAENEHRLLTLLSGRAAAGKAVLVASHSGAVMNAADRVVRLYDGQVIS
jgi:putative ABC transport system ATP-binding protein